MSSTPVNLPALRQLANEGFNTGVLAILEHRALTQAIARRELKGYTAHPADEVKQLAESMLPQGEQLYLLYTQTRAGLDKQQVQDLEQVSRNLSTCAQHLESAAARALASTKDSGLAVQASAMQVVGERYAQLIEAAQELERSGIISVTPALQGRLANLTSRPVNSPLSPFYDKAQALLAERQHVAPRQRMAA